MTSPGRGISRGITPVGWLRLAVVGHLLASGLHGVVHGTVPVPLPASLLAVTVAALFVLPLVGVRLLVTGRYRTGAWLVLAGTLPGTVIEAAAHFVVVNPDHVSQTTHVAFGPTALVSTLGSALAAASAAWYLCRHRHGGVVRSATDSST